MEKNNSVLYAILGGVITCFICVGMLFIFPSKGTKDLKGSDFQLPNNLINTGNNDEIALGDNPEGCTACSARWDGPINTTSVTHSCASAPGSTSLPTASCSSSSTTVIYSNSGAVGTQGDCNWQKKTYSLTKSCTSCSYGYYLSGSSCQKCQAGTYSVGGTVTSCTQCQAGTYAPEGAKECLQCNGVNSFSSSGAGSCSTCSEGYSANSTHTGCTRTSCPAGSYLDSSHSTGCSECPSGTYKSAEGNDSCVECDGVVNSTHTECTPNVCYCNADRTACAWTTTGSQTYPQIDTTKTTQTACLASTVRTCCVAYESAEVIDGTNVYKFENVESKYCVGYPNNIITDRANCLAKNPDPVITCFETTYDGEEHIVGRCLFGDFTSGSNTFKATEVGTYNLTCKSRYTSKTVTKTCEIKPSTEPVIKCLNPKYTRSAQTIATCENGTIISGATATEIGTHLVTCQGSKLVSKECSIEANAGQVCCCTGDKSMCSWMMACNSSYPSPQTDVKEAAACSSKESGEIPSKCTVAVSIGSVATSVAKDGEGDINSYYTVIVKVKGSDCGGQTLTYSASNAKSYSPKTYKVPTGSISTTTSFRVYPEKPCAASTATAKLSNGESSSATLSKNSIRTDWYEVENVCEKSPKNTAFYEADAVGDNIYYSNYDESKGCYTSKWYRYLCGSGTPSDSTPTPVPGEPTPVPPTPEVPHCYIDSEGEYHWTTTAQLDWKIVDNITKEFYCKKEETPACYIDSKGSYDWGIHGQDDGYTLITSITDAASCKMPTSEYACYKNEAGDYKWTTSAPSGYTKVDDIVLPIDCGPLESPACYLHGNDFVWGNYSNVTGYIHIENIENEEYCKLPATDACYKRPDGKYVWGKYGDDPSYTIIPSVTDPANCTNEVPVVPTASNVSKLVYVFMAILMACGIGFIYYSSVVRKNN